MFKLPLISEQRQIDSDPRSPETSKFFAELANTACSASAVSLDSDLSRLQRADKIVPPHASCVEGSPRQARARSIPSQINTLVVRADSCTI